jgi:hypothetical protein
MCGKRVKNCPQKMPKKCGKKLVTLGQILEHAGAGNYVGGLKYWNTPVVWGRRSPRQRRMRYEGLHEGVGERNRRERQNIWKGKFGWACGNERTREDARGFNILGRQKGSSGRRGGKHERELGREGECERTRRCDERTHEVLGKQAGAHLVGFIVRRRVPIIASTRVDSGD